ncbi:amino-acid N-acetyltransferase [Bacillus ectoiniformans]|uniref:N-acetyltransferase n=1 Tax=Bacillus ectoiniformans TaxID=1494429 RepID=UPI001957187D|nr:N-acetyltransferase [Bacillus ectoiniformans]MBM7649865.1 amino-acid N-acetyltransferase [Bacillus ectoiniformans]
MVIKDQKITIQKARVRDVEEIYELIKMYAEQGLLLPRTRESLFENLQAISVAVVDGQVVGAASLHILAKQLAEIRSLVVREDAKGCGVGKMLVQQIVEETKRMEVEKLISLTYQVPFFEKCGFRVIEKVDMPQKVWKDCLHCPKFPNCDEIAMAITF